MSDSYGWTEARTRGTRRLEPIQAGGSVGEPELAGLFDRLNLHHFGARLPLVSIRRGLPAGSLRESPPLALCRRVVLAAPVSTVAFTIHLAESLFTGPMPQVTSRWTEISSCLLHEMVHVAVDLDEIGGRFSDDVVDHGQEFANECNRIGRAAGWGHVVGAERAVTDQEDARWWPLDDACKTCAVVGPLCQAANRAKSSMTQARS